MLCLGGSGSSIAMERIATEGTPPIIGHQISSLTFGIGLVHPGYALLTLACSVEPIKFTTISRFREGLPARLRVIMAERAGGSILFHLLVPGDSDKARSSFLFHWRIAARPTPQPRSRTVAAATVRGDQQGVSRVIAFPPQPFHQRRIAATANSAVSWLSQSRQPLHRGSVIDAIGTAAALLVRKSHGSSLSLDCPSPVGTARVFIFPSGPSFSCLPIPVGWHAGSAHSPG